VLENKQVRKSFFSVFFTPLFSVFFKPDNKPSQFVSVHKNAKRELGQYPAILTLRLSIIEDASDVR